MDESTPTTELYEPPHDFELGNQFTRTVEERCSRKEEDIFDTLAQRGDCFRPLRLRVFRIVALIHDKHTKRAFHEGIHHLGDKLVIDDDDIGVFDGIQVLTILHSMDFPIFGKPTACLTLPIQLDNGRRDDDSRVSLCRLQSSDSLYGLTKPHLIRDERALLLERISHTFLLERHKLPTESFDFIHGMRKLMDTRSVFFFHEFSVAQFVEKVDMRADSLHIGFGELVLDCGNHLDGYGVIPHLVIGIPTVGRNRFRILLFRVYGLQVECMIIFRQQDFCHEQTPSFLLLLLPLYNIISYFIEIVA